MKLNVKNQSLKVLYQLFLVGQSCCMERDSGEDNENEKERKNHFVSPDGAALKQTDRELILKPCLWF